MASDSRGFQVISDASASFRSFGELTINSIELYLIALFVNRCDRR